MIWMRRKTPRRVHGAPNVELPLPPEEMRALVGSTDPSIFDNPSGRLVFEGLPVEHYRSVLDFGCGCGRVARQLIQQRPRPDRYVGLDLHAGMIKWCNEHLAPLAPGFEFYHHDVFYGGLNPGRGKPLHAALPCADGDFTLAIAISVFTHLTEDQTTAYLAELSRVLAPDGILLATWFLFDKRDFPMMQENQNTLFINEHDIRNAVIYDREWVRRASAEAGLVVCGAIPPPIRGHQWRLMMTHPRPGVVEVTLPEDLAEHGRMPPPLMPANASQIGRQEATSAPPALGTS
jgi:SAM-dependent methyltransferase